MSAGSLLVPLTCSTCGNVLAGGDAARIFLCRACRTAIFMEAQDRVYPAGWLSPRIGLAGDPVGAPFWMVTGSLRVTCPDARKEAAFSRIRRLGPLLFPAFWTLRLSYYDDLTQRFALADPALLSFGEPFGGALLDGVRDPALVPEMARLAWLAHLDRAADVTGVEARFDVERIAYAVVPFFQEGDQLRDGILGISVPRVLMARLSRDPGE